MTKSCTRTFSGSPFGRSSALLLLVGDSFDNASNSVRLDGYALADVRASLPLNDAVEFYGRVDNVFDTDYTTVARYNTYGRNAHIGVRAKF